MFTLVFTDQMQNQNLLVFLYCFRFYFRFPHLYFCVSLTFTHTNIYTRRPCYSFIAPSSPPRHPPATHTHTTTITTQSQFWIVVRKGPTALAVGASQGCLEFFSLVNYFFSPSLRETAPYRLKYSRTSIARTPLGL